GVLLTRSPRRCGSVAERQFQSASLPWRHTMRSVNRRGRSGVLVQPFDDTVKRSGNSASSRNFLIEALVRDWIERCSCTRHCRPRYPPDPPKKAYVRRNEFVEGSDAALKSREEVQHARQFSKSKTHIS